MLITQKLIECNYQGDRYYFHGFHNQSEIFYPPQVQEKLNFTNPIITLKIVAVIHSKKTGHVSIVNPEQLIFSF